MNILVTGVCGLIGRSIAIHLLNQKNTVTGIGRSNCNNLDESLLSNYFSIDLASQDAVKELNKVVLANDIDLVVHCAAQQPKADISFKKYMQGNVNTTESIVEWAKSNKVKAMISFSTVAFLDFPLEDDVAITELGGVSPKNYYALSKWVSESYMRLLKYNSNFAVLCFRIPSLVHEDQNGGVAYTYWNSAFKNTNLEVYDNGQYRRNLIYIDSILEVVDIAITKIYDYKGFNLYNLGSKDSWTLLEIAEYIYRKMGTVAKPHPVDQSNLVQGHWNIDTRKAQNELGFSPWSTREVLDSYIQNMNGRKV
jgi:UDP-glucose 4-epimerase